ncbi:uncharacterized protein LOC116033376 [Ipomoea triloba]|uniref:uncharacterized protein LOC116033376 n=1 Tax=Ipomoea triloba TaxID=35885 RepID=UPI00125E41B4|nr:uncharacterized protein LOC116033376 [Ipomoea triloba]
METRPQEPKSWVQMFKPLIQNPGMEEMHENKEQDEAEEPISDDEMNWGEDDPDCPRVIITKEEKARIRRPWRRSLIVRVLGRRVSYSYLLQRMKAMWRPEANMDLIALNDDYFVVKFEALRDYEFAKFEGPWMILRHYLIVQEWVPNFDPSNNKMEKLLVWVRFPTIPIEYFDEDIVEKIGLKVGRPIRVDDSTSLVSKGRFARIYIEVDMTKPLLSKFTMEGKAWPIEYEGIHLVCFRCGIYGHRKEQCGPKENADKTTEEDNADGEGIQPKEGNQEHTCPFLAKQPPKGPDLSARFGPWMIATRKARNGQKNTANRIPQGSPRRSTGGRGYHDKETAPTSELSARYGVLADLEEEDPMTEVPNQRNDNPRMHHVNYSRGRGGVGPRVNTRTPSAPEQ